MKKFKDLFYTILFFLLIAIFIFMTLIFPMLYDLSKAGELNFIGIIKYIAVIVLSFVIAAYIRGFSE